MELAARDAQPARSCLPFIAGFTDFTDVVLMVIGCALVLIGVLIVVVTTRNPLCESGVLCGVGAHPLRPAGLGVYIASQILGVITSTSMVTFGCIS